MRLAMIVIVMMIIVSEIIHVIGTKRSVNSKTAMSATTSITNNRSLRAWMKDILLLT